MLASGESERLKQCNDVKIYLEQALENFNTFFKNDIINRYADSSEFDEMFKI